MSGPSRRRAGHVTTSTTDIKRRATMKAYCILALLMGLVFIPSACPQKAKIYVQQLDGHTFTTVSHGDLTLTYVELDKSTAVVFKPVGGGGFDSIDLDCWTCTISKISECSGPGKDSAAINACAKEKCQAEGRCKTAPKSNFSFGIIRL
jgi:hypothetical protein